MKNFRGNPVRFALLLIAAAVALALSACGDDESSTSSGPDPASLTPADAPFYGEAVIKPEGDTKEGVEGALSKLLGTDDVGSLITSQLDAALQEDGVSWSEDVEPVLDSTAGGFVSSFTAEKADGAVIVSVTDTGDAQALMDKLDAADDTDSTEAEYEGVSYKTDEDGSAFGIVGDFAVLGTEAGFQSAVDASNGDSLADDDAATDALDSVPDDTLSIFYIDAKAAVDAALAAGAITQQDLDRSGATEQLEALEDSPVLFSTGANADSISFEFSGPAGEETEATDIVSTLPSEAWLAFGVPDVGATITKSWDQFVSSLETSLTSGVQDLQGSLDEAGIKPTDIPDLEVEIENQIGLKISEDLGWIGNLGAFVQGGSIFDIGGGIVIETDDPEAATAALAKLRTALGRQRSLQITETEDGGFNITAADAPVGAEVAIRDDKVVFAFAGATVDDVLEPSETLADSDAFTAAQDQLGDDLTTSFFMDAPPLLSLLESTGATSDPDYQSAAPYLSAINYLVAGGGTSDDRAVGRFVIGLQEPTTSSETSAAVITP